MPIDPFEAREASGTGLKRNIGLWQLTSIGIGATIGTGIFFILSVAVPTAGPAAIVSFVIAGIVAGLTAICYAELAGAVPVSGSSYSYAYASLGELAAVIVGSCLFLSYGVSASAVAVGWAQYLNQLLSSVLGVHLPHALSYGPDQGGIINLPAVVLVGLCSLLLIRGASESARMNLIMVCIKISVLLLFIGVAITGWNADHFAGFWDKGMSGIMAASGVIIFTYLGIDTLSTAGEEAKNPRRNLPLAILLSLVIVSALYIAVVVVAIGAQEANQFNEQSAGLAVILEQVTGQSWPGIVFALGAIISIFSVTLVVIYGQTRILYTMSRDGLAPKLFGELNPRTRTPVKNTIVVGTVVGLFAGFVPLNLLAEMTSVGALIAFIVVSIGVMILRRTHPGLPRSFKVPFYPVTPILSIIGCIWIIAQLQPLTVGASVLWVCGGLIIYAIYGYRNSRLGRGEMTPADALPAFEPSGEK